MLDLLDRGTRLSVLGLVLKLRGEGLLHRANGQRLWRPSMVSRGIGQRCCSASSSAISSTAPRYQSKYSTCRTRCILVECATPVPGAPRSPQGHYWNQTSVRHARRHGYHRSSCPNEYEFGARSWRRKPKPTQWRFLAAYDTNRQESRVGNGAA